MKQFCCELDCSQSPIFSWDRLGIPRLTVTGILIFKCTEGAGVGDTHARWQPVTHSARSRRSYGKIEDCEQSSCELTKSKFFISKKSLHLAENSYFPLYFELRQPIFLIRFFKKWLGCLPKPFQNEGGFRGRGCLIKGGLIRGGGGVNKGFTMPIMSWGARIWRVVMDCFGCIF